MNFEAGDLIEIRENKYKNFYYEILDQVGAHVRLWEV